MTEDERAKRLLAGKYFTVELTRDYTRAEWAMIKVLALNEDEAEKRVKDALENDDIEDELNWGEDTGDRKNAQIYDVYEWKEGLLEGDDLDELLADEK